MDRTISDMSFENDEPILFDTTTENTAFDFNVEDSDSELLLDLTTSPSHGPTESKKPVLEDEALAFLMEAGLDNPEDLKSLGIDIDEIRTQQQIEANINHDTDRDFRIAQEMQRSLNETSTPPIKSEVAGPSNPRCIDMTSASSSFSPYRNNFITINDFDDEEIGEQLIDLTNDTMEVQAQSDDDLEMNDDDDIQILSSLFSIDTSSHVMRRQQKNKANRATPYPLPPLLGIPGPATPILQQNANFIRQAMAANIPHMTEAIQTAARLHHSSGRMDDRELRELLENIEYDDIPLPEDRTGTPEGLICNLLEHQKIGLEWMKKMENSNNKGGILADDMGLGKTVQALATILAMPCRSADIIPPNVEKSRLNVRYKIKATLIVCPVSLIDQWRREIETKTSPMLKVMCYHGQKRVSDLRTLSQCDVIITSYGIAATNFSYDDERNGPLARCIFHRVILDEAHMIKNESTRMAVGCCSIQASYRWCLTATPIQNKIEELYSIIKFLRIRPFCDWTEFRTTISGPIKKGGTQQYRQGVRACQYLLRAICLRRSKKTKIDGRPILNLPERNVHMTHIDFTEDERAFYECLNSRVQARFNAYVRAGTVMKRYSSVLVLLLRLRQACLHPELTLKEADENDLLQQQQQNNPAASPEDTARNMKPEVVNRLLNSDSSLLEIECPICMDIAQNAQIISNCGHILCKECFDGYINSNGMTAKRCPHCRGDLDARSLVTVEAFLKVHAPDQYEEAQQEISKEEVKELQDFAEFLSSTKIDKMLEILQATKEETGGKDKTIVFSQFTSFLDLVEEPLTKAGHKFLRYDGSMSVQKRAETVNQFFENPEITVLLVSTRCGSLGLNLTVANRVILLDLWWNPAMENQAIDRVHRIGQEKSVEVHRLFINNTVEDRILRLQQKKQDLSDNILGEGRTGNVTRLGLQELMYLFRGGEVPESSTT